MTGWTAKRIPIAVAPLPGEALDSWLGAYARRLRTTSNGLLDHLGLGSSPMTQMVLRLHEHEVIALEQATGVSRQVLAAMTLEPFDGLAVAIEHGHRTRLARFPTGRFPGAHVRYCPGCLARDDSRGPLTWRLPWTFACPQHHVLLLDVCPACQRPPRPWNIRRLGPTSTGACTRDNPDRQGAGHRGGGVCGTDLTCAPTVRLPAAGLVLAAYEHLASLLAGPSTARLAAMTALRQIYVAYRQIGGEEGR